ncbi:NUDIX hydrolase [Mobilibacterium timonense]|uniref:NUDIX hydrolase n=1 Tax=Mobilibacterium timonense TaxID=1871012 RepID=UPI003A92AFFF
MAGNMIEAGYAVLVPLVESEQGTGLLLEVRTEYVKQPGEICFPGGKIEYGETAVDAAARETCEELGIAPGNIQVIREMETEVMADGKAIRPVLAEVGSHAIENIVLSGCEVADTFILPLKWVSENPPSYYDLAVTDDRDLPEKLRGYLRHYGRHRRVGHTYYIEYEGHGIWGFTARVICKLVSGR